MSITTYSELQTAIGNWLERDDLTGRITEFIELAEARHKREIRMREMISRESLTVDNRYINLPSGFLEALNFRLLTNPVTVLEEVNPHEMTRQRESESGTPKWFTIHEQIEFDVVPDSSYTGDITFYSELTPLSGANTTNALLTNAPDAYLYAALSASAPFLMNDERLRVWESLYQQARDGVNARARSSRRVGPLISRVVGDTP